MRKRVASPLIRLIPRGNRGCYPPGPDAADSDCYQSDADLDEGCYGSGPSAGHGLGSDSELLRALITPRRPRPRPRRR